MITGIVKLCGSLRPCLQRTTFAVPPSHISAGIHTTCVTQKNYDRVPKKWLANNEHVYRPQLPGDERRPGWVCHQRTNIKYSTHKMWYIAAFIRGMSIDEAIKQLTFLNKKGAVIMKEVLLEAQDLAVREHNIEYKSNLWIAASNVGKGQCVKGYRRHARGRLGIVMYNYCHYFVRLQEGPPPKHFYAPEATGHEKLAEYMDGWRKRRIFGSL